MTLFSVLLSDLRAYAGKLSFLPVAEYTPKTAMAPKTLKKIRRFSLRSMSSSLSSLDSLDSRQSRSSSVVLTGARSLGSTPPSVDKVRNVSMSSFTNGGGDANFTITEQSGSETDSPSPNKPALNHRQSDMGNGEGGVGTKVAKDAPSSAAAVVQVTSSMEVNSSTAHSAHQPHSFERGDSASGLDLLANGTTPGSSEHNTTSSVTSANFEEETVYGAKKAGQAVPTPFLPPIDQPVPDNWVVIEGKFIMACAVYQTHLGSDMLAAPSARLADGIINLMFIREGVSRNQLLNLFLMFSEGTHVDSPDVEFVPVLAFRLEPEQNSGNIMIDGERLDPVPIQGQVLPGLARVMAIQ